jgi:hypothetical protein
MNNVYNRIPQIDTPTTMVPIYGRTEIVPGQDGSTVLLVPVVGVLNSTLPGCVPRSRSSTRVSGRPMSPDPCEVHDAYYRRTA